MKMKRSQLKSLVKECLFEILLESTGQSTQSLTEGRIKSRRTSGLRPALDNISYDRKQIKKPKPKPRAIDISEITSDPVMASIFQDTAATTLQEQMAAERGVPIAGGDAASLTVSNSDPAELFSEASQNWAALAFSESPKK